MAIILESEVIYAHTPSSCKCLNRPISHKDTTAPFTMHCLHVFSHLSEAAKALFLLPRSFTLHSRDSLIKEQHYLRAAALLAVRNALFSVPYQERKRDHTTYNGLLLTLLHPMWPMLCQ